MVETERIEAEEPKNVTTKSNVDSFIDILKYSNYKVLWCYKLVFRAVTFYKNAGSILTMIYFIGYLISFYIVSQMFDTFVLSEKYPFLYAVIAVLLIFALNKST